MPTAVFDTLAPVYDAHFSESALGRLLRRAIWRWLDRAFAPRARVLELGCGTGEDALHLAERGVRVLATDASPAMLQVAQAKVDYRRVNGLVEVRQLEIERLDDLGREFRGLFDGAFSSFGGLNCVGDLPRVAASLADLLKPGARVILCLMGPYVPWEWAWFLARGEVRKAVRRLSRGGVPWRGMTVRYPSLRTVQRAFGAQFAAGRRAGLGVLLPPTYTEDWARRHPRLLGRLDRWERHIESWPLVPWLGDHYLVELVRR
jgi:SAM-dependent methyltransferase